MTDTVTGVLGQLAHQDEEVIGVICRDDDTVLFIRVPWDVAAQLVKRPGDPLLIPGKAVVLTGHLCDHGSYLVVADAAAPT